MSHYPDRLCGLSYDAEREPRVGQYIVSMSRKTQEPTGKAYRIESVKKVKSDIHPARWGLKCKRCLEADIPPEATRLPLFWYSRNKK